MHASVRAACLRIASLAVTLLVAGCLWATDNNRGATVAESQLVVRPAVVVADGRAVATVQVQLMGSNKVVRPNQTVHVYCRDSNVVVAQAQDVTDARGIVEATLTSAVATSTTVYAAWGGARAGGGSDDGFTLAAEASVAFVLLPRTDGNGSGHGDDDATTGEGDLAVRLTLSRDQAVADANDAIALVAYGPALAPLEVLGGLEDNDSLAPPALRLGGDGRWQPTWRATHAGPRILRVRVAEQEAQIAAKFVAGPPNLHRSGLRVLSTTYGDDGLARVTLRFDLADALGNPIVDQEVALAPLPQALNVTVAPPLGRTGASSLPQGLVLADLNNDGIVDVAVGNYAAGSVRTYLGNGTGQLVADKTIGSITQPSDLVAIDYSGDGTMDMVVSQYGAGKVLPLLGAGNGNFTVAADSNAVTAFQSMVVGDFNGDGIADLFIAGDQTRGLALGGGDGNFTPKTISPFANVAAFGASYYGAVGDIDGDGHLDYAITADIGLGDGAGGFRHGALAYLTPLGYGATALGDFNGDGLLDFVTTSSQQSNLSVYLNGGCP